MKSEPAYRRGVRLTVTIAPKASAMIDTLLATGLHGHSRADVAKWFIYAGLREALGPDGPLRPRTAAQNRKRAR